MMNFAYATFAYYYICFCKSLFRTMLNIYEGSFSAKLVDNLAVNYFHKNAQSYRFDRALNKCLFL